MSILITGGAGYIGSHMIYAALERGERVIVLDNLATGVRALVAEDAEFHQGDAGNIELVSRLIKEKSITAVIHFAGSVVVPDSVADPLAYYANNTVASRNLIEACIKGGVKHFIFSSTAAVYGTPEHNPVGEDTPLYPINPYGRSKLMTEWMLQDASRAHDFCYVALRYFNVAGGDPQGRTGQSTPRATHLIKRACQAALGRVPALEPLPGFKEVKPQVFAGLYPVEANQYEALRESLEKLKLNDASLQYEPEVSQALGFGFRCGFLGLLHMEIVQERLEREFDMDLITTAPTVVYQVELSDQSKVTVDNPSKMPEPSKIANVLEPIVVVNLYMPQEYVGAVITLCTGKRGVQTNMQYLGRQVQLTYEIPMAEIVMDFFDRLKSISRGYASMDYEFKEYRPSDVVKVDILINGDKVDALSIIVHRSNSQYRGREVVSKMREIIPRQMFDVAIQAAIGSGIIARENVKALRKNVLAKCYGGDISRKRKLLEKQKAGKKRMKQIGNVEIPQEAFLAILQVEDK